MTSIPKTQYAQSGELSIAYQCVGEGPIEFMDEKFDDLRNRIRRVAQAHDSFLTLTNSL